MKVLLTEISAEQAVIDVAWFLGLPLVNCADCDAIALEPRADAVALTVARSRREEWRPDGLLPGRLVMPVNAVWN